MPSKGVGKRKSGKDRERNALRKEQRQGIRRICFFCLKPLNRTQGIQLPPVGSVMLWAHKKCLDRERIQKEERDNG